MKIKKKNFSFLQPRDGLIGIIKSKGNLNENKLLFRQWTIDEIFQNKFFSPISRCYNLSFLWVELSKPKSFSPERKSRTWPTSSFYPCRRCWGLAWEVGSRATSRIHRSGCCSWAGWPFGVRKRLVLSHKTFVLAAQCPLDLLHRFPIPCQVKCAFCEVGVWCIDCPILRLLAAVSGVASYNLERQRNYDVSKRTCCDS